MASSAWQGVAEGLNNLNATGMNILRFNADEARTKTAQGFEEKRLGMEQDRMKLEQDRAAREKAAFDYQQEQIQKQEKLKKAIIPASMVAPGILKSPKYRQQAIDAAREVGFNVVEHPNGDIYAPAEAYAFIKTLHDTNHAFAIAEAENIYDDLSSKSITLTKQILELQNSGKSDEKTLKPLLDQQAVLSNQIASAIRNKQDVMAKIIEAQATKTETPDMTTIYGPNGQTQKVAVPKSGVYTPPVGWSLKAPTAEKTAQPYVNSKGEVVAFIDPNDAEDQKRVIQEGLKPVPLMSSESRAAAFGQIPNAATGAVYFRITDKQHPEKGWYIDTAGGPMKLTGEQMKNLGLEAKEESTASDIKSMQQSAPAVLDFVKVLNKQISDAEKGLGPMASRWRELTQGKIGLNDPAFTALKTNADLLVTRLMKMHVGARGSEYIMQEFKKMLAFEKQSPENLKASLKAIEDYANLASKGRIPKLFEEAVKKSEGGGSHSVIKYDAKGNRVQ